MRLLAALLAIPLLAAVDGTVMNLSTKAVQPGVTLTLIQANAQGVKTLGTTTSGPDGRYRIEVDPPEGPTLLQGLYQGVTYTLMMGPGQPRTGAVLNVHNVTKKQEVVKLSQHMVVLEPTAERIQVGETFLLTNSSNDTLSDPLGGALRIVLPQGAGQARVMVQSGVMPVERPLQETRQKGVFKIDYPVRPGETRFDLSYDLPAGPKFAGRTVYKDASTRLVTPTAVTLAGTGITPLGQEPTTQANIYDTKGTEYAVDITGTGTLRPPPEAAAAEGGAQGGGQAGGPEIKQVRPKLYERLYWILSLTLAILALGFALIYRADAPPPETRKS